MANMWNSFVSNIGAMNAPFGFAPGQDPYQSGLQYIGNIGTGMLASGDADPLKAFGKASIMAQEKASDDSRQRLAQKMMMDSAEEKRKEREAQAQQQAMMEEAISQLPPDQQAMARMMPEKFFGEQISQQFAGPTEPKRYEVGDALVDANGQVVYQGQSTKPRRTSVQSVNGREVLVDLDTGETIKDLGMASNRQQNAPSGFRWKDNVEGGSLEPIPGGPGTQVPAELAARIGMSESFFGQVPEIISEIDSGLMSGPIDAGKAVQGIGKQGSTYRKIQSGADALQRLLTGAGMNVAEAEAYANRYLPSYTDTAETMKDKVRQLERELRAASDRAMKGRGGMEGGSTVIDGYTIEEQ